MTNGKPSDMTPNIDSAAGSWGELIESHLGSLRELAVSLQSPLDVDHILVELLSAATRIVNAESGIAALCFPEGISGYRRLVKGERVIPEQRWEPREPVPGRLYLKGAPYLSRDATHDPEIAPALAARYDVSTLVSTPMLDFSGNNIGFLEIHNKRGRVPFTSLDQALLAAAAQIAALAAKSANAFRSLRQSQAEVSQLLAQVQKNAAELEVRVAERTAQLEEINAELDAFAHSVSHDLRAPLRGMQGFTEILLDDGSLEETERIEYLTRIMSTARGMDRLVQDLLAYSRISRQDILLQSVSLDQVVREAVQQLELACGGKRYLLEVARDLPEVVGHPVVLVQVLLNLMSNGIKFVPAGTTPKLRIWAERKDARCRLFVADNGIGIPPLHQERIFKIFERLHSTESFPGSGVGLAIVRKAITRLGGRVGVESREGEGSRFWIELPMASGPA